MIEELVGGSKADQFFATIQPGRDPKWANNGHYHWETLMGDSG